MKILRPLTGVIAAASIAAALGCQGAGPGSPASGASSSVTTAPGTSGTTGTAAPPVAPATPPPAPTTPPGGDPAFYTTPDDRWDRRAHRQRDAGLDADAPSKRFDAALPGDTIVLAAGTHTTSGGNLVMRVSGTGTAWIAIRAAAGARPAIDLGGSGELTLGGSFVLLDGVEIKNGGWEQPPHSRPSRRPCRTWSSATARSTRSRRAPARRSRSTGTTRSAPASASSTSRTTTSASRSATRSSTASGVAKAVVRGVTTSTTTRSAATASSSRAGRARS